jgi:hypothetical protein
MSYSASLLLEMIAELKMLRESTLNALNARTLLADYINKLAAQIIGDGC